MGETDMSESNPVIEIFELRRQSAEQNLGALDDFLKSISARTEALRELREKLAYDRGEIRATLKKLNIYVNELCQKLDIEDIEKGEMRSPVNYTRENLTGLEEAIKSAREHWTRISGLKLDPKEIELALEMRTP